MSNLMKNEGPGSRLKAFRSATSVERAKLLSSVMRGYFPLARDEDVAKGVDALIESFFLVDEETNSLDQPSNGRLGEGRAFVVVGDSGTGKTRTVHRVLSKVEGFEGYMRRDGSSPLVSVVAPSPCTLKQLGHTIAAALGYETARDLRENVVWAVVRRQLQLSGVRFLHIDDLQHVFQSGNPEELQKIRDTLKSLMQTLEWPIWLILSGLPSIAPIIEGDFQVRRRSTFVRFEPLLLGVDDPLIEKILKNYIKRGGLLLQPKLALEEFRGRLMHASSGRTGLLIEFTQDAIAGAMISGAREVSVAHFAATYEKRTGCRPGNNVFLAPNWSEIDPLRALYPPKPQEGTVDKERAPKDERNI